MTIAILGWGSLLWDTNPAFDAQHDHWKMEGPVLPIEFCRVSTSRGGALTLVLDTEHGQRCRVAYCLSKRKNIDDVVCDLRCREGTTVSNIGRCVRGNNCGSGFGADISAWAEEKSLDAVVWTALKSNFQTKSHCRQAFSVRRALAHIQSLDSIGKSKAAEYIWRAPDFVDTPLRRALQVEPWFKSLVTNKSG